MNILRTTITIFLGLFFAFCTLRWMQDAGFSRDNFSTPDAFCLSLCIVIPLALASSSALVSRVLPVKKIGGAKKLSAEMIYAGYGCLMLVGCGMMVPRGFLMHYYAMPESLTTALAIIGFVLVVVSAFLSQAPWKEIEAKRKQRKENAG